jgi:hypothetical protein
VADRTEGIIRKAQEEALLAKLPRGLQRQVKDRLEAHRHLAWDKVIADLAAAEARRTAIDDSTI